MDSTESSINSALVLIEAIFELPRLFWSEWQISLLQVGELKSISLRSVDDLEFGPLSQEQLDRWHAGCVQFGNAMSAEIGGYNSQTKNMTNAINLWNGLVQFLKQFPDQITFPNTPDNQRKVLEGRQAQDSFVANFNRGTDVALNNLERDVVAFDAAVNALCLARQAFENSPSSVNNLGRIQTGTTAAQAKLDAIKPYVVVDNQRSRNLFAMEERAFNRALPCARIDEIDRLREEYISFNFSTVPARSTFQQLGQPWNFGEYSYGLISASVQKCCAENCC